MKKYRQKNRQKLIDYAKIYYKTHKKEWRKYWDNEETRKRDKIYRRKNRELYRKLYRNKRKTDINYKLAHNLRRRLRGLLHGIYKTSSVLILLDCSIEELKKYLQIKFKKGMTWNNYGKVWEIDHIKPCCKFNLIKISEQKKCFHYTNLQPLTVAENRSKRDGL